MALNDDILIKCNLGSRLCLTIYLMKVSLHVDESGLLHHKLLVIDHRVQNKLQPPFSLNFYFVILK